jgi:aspartate aminotransferase-like enzyme
MKNYLLAPGPTPVPEEALLELAKPVYHHRTPQFKKLFKDTCEGLKEVFLTKNDVFIFAASGTGAMEAAVVNLLGREDAALVVQGGKFGERFGELCKAYNIETELVDVEWGRAVEPAEIEKRLKANPKIAAVFVTLCETSTGVHSDVKAIGEIVKKTDAVLVVDGISSVGAVECRTDEWGIDMLVVGSQKALMLPPGLALLAVSPKAWKKVEKNSPSAYYFDLKAAKKALDKGDTPYTPALTLIIALKKTTEMILEQGLERTWARSSLLAEATRAAAEALGLELLAERPSDAITAIKLPEGIDGEAVPKKMRDEYGVTIAGGQAKLKGKIARIAHMGYISGFDVLTAIAALEMTLKELGATIELGKGLTAAEEVLLEGKEKGLFP